MREWLYRVLLRSPELRELFASRVYSTTRLDSPPNLKPFLVYRVGNRGAELRGDDDVVTYNSPVQIFVHDEIGDYLRIARGIRLVERLLTTQSGLSVVQRVRWIEDGPELRDEDFGTNVIYSRYQIIHT